MHQDELQIAVKNVIEVLNKADLLSAIQQVRASKNEDNAVASARLGHAGGVLMENMENFSANEHKVASILHLDELRSPAYWQSLLFDSSDTKRRTAALVQLYSRVMFATSHLPNLAKLLDSTESVSSASSVMPAQPLSAIDGGLTIRLTDAGERAADPDRIARSIDGVDMLYSACASIARKPAMDLALVRVDGNDHRDLHFIGEKDSVAAVRAVLESIPDALNDIDPEQDIDLNQIVGSLPIFRDLDTLASLGTFSASDLNDIRETMHQGALLALESGVILVKAEPRQAAVAPVAVGGEAIPLGGTVASVDSGGDRDEHYENYLREREAMQRQGGAAEPAAAATLSPQERQEAVEELLKNLGRSRGDAG